MPRPSTIGTAVSANPPAGGNDVSVSITIPAGANAVVAGAGGFDNETVTGITLDGGAMENMVSGQNGTAQFGGLFYMDDQDVNWPGTGTFTLLASLSGSTGGDNRHILATCLQDVDTSTVGYRTGVESNGNGDDPSVSLTGMDANTDLMIALAIHFEKETATATGGTDIIEVDNGGSASSSLLLEETPTAAADAIGITTAAAVDRWMGGVALIGTSDSTTASGSPSIPASTASGAATVRRDASGTPSVTAPTASGAATVHRDASGSPSTPAVTGAGVATVRRVASGTPSTPAVTAAGTATVSGANVTASGSPSTPAATASGQASRTSVKITDVNTDESWTDGETGLPITGSGFV